MRAALLAALLCAAAAQAQPHHKRKHARHAPREIVVKPTLEREPEPAPEPPRPPTPAVAPARAEAAPATVAPPSRAEVEVTRAAPPPPRPVALELAVGAGVVSRELSFNDDLFSQLHGYASGAAPAVDAAVAWFPGAPFTRGAGAHLGVRVSGRFVAVGKSRFADGVSYPTTAYDAGVELIGRAPIGRFQPELAVGWGRDAFEIHDAPGHPKPAIPSVTQDFVRFGLGLRAAVWRLELGAHGAYRLIVGAGELTSTRWFPRATLHAIDAGASVTLRLPRGFALRGAFLLERMFATLDPRPGDPRVAGGAVDQSLSGTLQLAYAF